jgi:prepilin-type N-terminal cleavage/methylation domain-containing protein
MMGRGLRKDRKAGVTLIELIIVMTIIGIMALFMVPSIENWAAAFRLRGATKDLADALQLAKIKAISTGMQYRVQLNINKVGNPETFVVQYYNTDNTKGPIGWTDDGATITLPSGVNITQVNPGSIQTGIINLMFNTNGMNATATAYTIDLLDQKNSQYYNIAISQTGVVAMNTGP